MTEYHLRIKELPAGEQPRERLRDYGPAALSDAELLADRLSRTNSLECLYHLTRSTLRPSLGATSPRMSSASIILRLTSKGAARSSSSVRSNSSASVSTVLTCDAPTAAV